MVDAVFGKNVNTWDTDNKLLIINIICENRQQQKVRICTFQQVSMTEV